MKIRSIHIAGYGRFADTALEFAPGLQVIVGPNEKGKSTIRGFITDMLYGQKSSTSERTYEESNTLRAPWEGVEHYGGSLVYELDDGRVIAVERCFDRERESVRVFDRTADEDITDTFTRYRNRELDFAVRHLGLDKPVFLHTATLSHDSLTDLGDSEALDRIREIMLALADSGGSAGTAEGALSQLSARIAAIGRPDARNRPLPLARQRRAALAEELKAAREQQASVRALALARRAVLDKKASLQAEKRGIEGALRTLDHFTYRDRLEKAEELQTQIAAMARRAEALGAGGAFPLDRDGEVQAAHRAVLTCEKQVEKLRAQLESARSQHIPGPVEVETGGTLPGDFPPALEEEISDALAKRSQVASRMDETVSLLASARSRMEEVQARLAELPDFSRLAADPVEWLSQLSNSFSLALRARDEECAVREELRGEVEALEDANAPYEGLFANCDEFPELAREYEVQARVHEEQQKRQASELHSLQVTYVEARGETQAFLPIGIVCLLVAAGLGAMYLTQDNAAMGFPAAVAFVMGLVFMGMRSERRGRLARLEASIAQAEQELKKLEKARAEAGLEVIARLLRESGLDTVRELEALHDAYRTRRLELRIRREALAAQQEKASEAEERIPQLLERLRDTFSKAGEDLRTEADVQEAASRAIARYQAYREMKRRVTSNRAVLERHEAELKRLETEAAGAETALEGLETEARAFVRRCGFPRADEFGALKELISAYRQWIGELRERQGRSSQLAEHLSGLERQLESDHAELEGARAHLDSLLAAQGVESLEAWNAAAADARDRRAIDAQRAALEDRLAALLGNQSTVELRERVARTQGDGSRPSASREGLEEQLAQATEAIERMVQEEHAIHVQLTQLGARARSIAEIEEEAARNESSIRELEAEIEAASYAMALIEELSSSRHAAIAPRLAAIASDRLATITDGRYTELHLTRDLGVRIRVSATDRLEEAPEKTLSKGTVDQIYLALRLAFVQCVSENGESVPMLLDDPFANYDDARLSSTLSLLSRLEDQGQVLLFTCREDVVTVSESLSIPIIRL
ncbi:MAG: AAA family ATPase [Candidatus Hydrogenedentes bacterium]|nr:AAA family ATPase [Candidatus Hydrogenedentota bacterium]